jgi:hypothetical protein
MTPGNAFLVQPPLLDPLVGIIARVLRDEAPVGVAKLDRAAVLVDRLPFTTMAPHARRRCSAGNVSSAATKYLESIDTASRRVRSRQPRTRDVR